MQIHPSISEERGLAAIPPTATNIYSVGVSTAGVAELRMVEGHPERHVTATTVDAAGAASVEVYLASQPHGGQIDVRLEDVSAESLSYADGEFDFTYARLVLHYLDRNQLPRALNNLHRITRTGGGLFVVVRSANNPDAVRDTSVYDPDTGFTTYEDVVESKPGAPVLKKRLFHTRDSIAAAITAAGFTIGSMDVYKEQLFSDFGRSEDKRSPHYDELIEVRATRQ